jgi:hypothetical protein
MRLGVEGLSDQLVRDRADKHAGPESHDQAQHDVGNSRAKRDQATEDQGGAREDTPGEASAI